MNEQSKFALKAVIIFIIWVVCLFILPFKVGQIIQWAIGFSVMDWGLIVIILWSLSIGLGISLSAAAIGEDLK